MGRVAVLGAGKVGHRHLEAYQRVPGAEVVGILEPHEERLSAALADLARSIPRYASLDDVLSDPEVDVVDICSPTPLHFEQVCRSLRAGKTVFCEKPLVPSVAEVEEIARLLSTADTSLRVGYVYRSHPRIELLKQRLDDEVLGTPYMAVFRIGGRGSHRAWKHGRASGGGALLDMASHMLDLAYWFFGGIDEVESLYSGLLLSKREIDGEQVEVDADDVVIVRLRTLTGVEILVHADFLSPGFANWIEVSGKNGSALVSIISGLPDRYVLRSAARGLPAGETLEQGRPVNMLERELAAFIADVNERRVVKDIDASLLVAQVVESFMERSRGA